MLNEIAAKQPGRRFLHIYKRQRKWEAGRPWRAVWATMLAIFLLLVAFIFGFLPILPGWILALPAVALLAGRTRRGARFLDRTEVRLRRFKRLLQRKK